MSRISAPGHAIFHARPFSARGGWLLTVGPGGGQVVFKINPNTGKPVLANGQPVRIEFVPEMVPHSPTGLHCAPTGAVWSEVEEGVIYLSGCGTQVFKYNLNAYDPLRPMAGLMRGTSKYSKAVWPTACIEPCRKGPVYLDLSPDFGVLADYGGSAYIRILGSSGDNTIAGCIFRAGYKNCQVMFAYKPATDQMWRGVGRTGVPSDPFFYYRGLYQGVPANQRILGIQLDQTGNYLGIIGCSDNPPSYDNCNDGSTFVVDLRTIPTTTRLDQAPAISKDDTSHGDWAAGRTIGPINNQQIVSHYFEGNATEKEFVLPAFPKDKWWPGYFSTAPDFMGPNREQLVGGASLASIERNPDGSNSPLTNCPNRNCLYANEILLYNLSGTHFIRLAQNRSLIPSFNSGAAYWDLPRLGMSKDARLVAFNSNWGTPSPDNGPYNFAVYVVRTPDALPYLLDDTSTMTPIKSSAAVGEFKEFRFSHLRGSYAAEVLFQDRAMNGPSRINACYFRLNDNGTVVLADDRGVFDERTRGSLGIPGQAFLQNSQCRIDVAGSGVVATNIRANEEYRVRIFFQEKWAGKNLKAVMTNLPAVRWQDVGEVALSTALVTWLETPGTVPVAVTSTAISSAGGNYGSIYATRRLDANGSFEFRIQNPHVTVLAGVDTAPPAYPAQAGFWGQMVLLPSVGNTWTLQIAENRGANMLAVIDGVKVGDLLKMAYVNGRLVYSLNGTVVATSRNLAPPELLVALYFTELGGRITDWVLR